MDAKGSEETIIQGNKFVRERVCSAKRRDFLYFMSKTLSNETLNTYE